MKTLFDEAVDALNTDTVVLSDEESRFIVDKFESSFPFLGTGNGKIDWNNIQNYQTINTISDILSISSYSISKNCFIIWNDSSLAVIQSKLSHVITVFDDITAVSFDTWIFIPETNNVIENTFGSLKITTN